MMQFNFFELLYDNFILVVYLAIGCIIFVLAFTSWIIRAQIGTRVLMVRKTTGEFKKAKEPLGKGVVKIGKKSYKVNGEPIFCHSLLRPYRFYLNQDGSDEVLSPALYVKKAKGEDTKDEDKISNDAFQELLENEVITQSVKGLVGSLMDRLILLAAGGFIGIVIWEILRGLFA